MACKPTWIGSLSAMVDDETGAILCMLTGTIHADVIEPDIDALIDGIAGEKTLSDLWAKIEACNTAAVTVAGSALPAGAAKETTLANVVRGVDSVVSADYTATIGASSVLSTAFSTGELPASLLKITLIPQGDVYVKVGGAASAATTKIPLGGMAFAVTAAVAATIQIFAAGVPCSLLLSIPRS